MAREYDYEVRDASESERDEWVDAVESLPYTHTVQYRPVFRLRVKLPPWVDAEAWLTEATGGWDEELPLAGESWSQPGGYAWIEVECLGSGANIRLPAGSHTIGEFVGSYTRPIDPCAGD